MKVLCIDAATRPNEFDAGAPLVEGEIYTVIAQEMGYGPDPNDPGSPCYELLERGPVKQCLRMDLGDKLLYDVDRFVPLSNKNEETIKQQEVAFA